MAVEGRRLPAMVRKEGQKPLLQLRSLLQTAVSTARLRPSSVSLGTIATQLLATPVCVVRARGRGRVNVRARFRARARARERAREG